jgi:ABC-type phosphate transport system substrate-binding protein
MSSYSCKQKKCNLCGCTGNSNGAGSTLQTPFDQEILALYNAIFAPGTPNQLSTPWEYNQSPFLMGSSNGVAQVISGDVAFGGTDVYPSSAQDLEAVAVGNFLLNFPIVEAGVAIGYGADIASALATASCNGLSLTAQDIINIFTGAIATLDGLSGSNPCLAGNNTPIASAYRTDGSGDTANLVGFLNAVVPSFPNTGTVTPPTFVYPSVANPTPVNPVPSTGVVGNNGMQAFLLSGPGTTGAHGFGYIAYGYTLDTGGDPMMPLVEPIPSAAVGDTGAPFVPPTLPSIQIATNCVTSVPTNLRLNTLNCNAVGAYRIANPTNIVVNQFQPSKCEVVALRQVLNFFSTAGNNLAPLYNFGQLLSNPVILAQYQANLCLLQVQGAGLDNCGANPITKCRRRKCGRGCGCC